MMLLTFTKVNKGNWDLNPFRLASRGGGGSERMFNEGVSPSKLTGAPNYGGRVPVDTTPGPAPMCRALKIHPSS